MLQERGIECVLEYHALQSVGADTSFKPVPLWFDEVQVRRVGRQEQSTTAHTRQDALHRFFAMKAGGMIPKPS